MIPNVQNGLYYRHRLPVRIMHWINAITLLALLGSGLQIFNAHPVLYWGQSSYTGDPPLLSLAASVGADGRVVGTTTILGHRFDTTGVLGASTVDGRARPRGFPSWATIPGDQWLAMGRRWHFFFAWVFVLNGVAYLIWSVASRHLARDLWPTRTDWRAIGRSLIDHLLLRHARGAEALRYNVLQKLSYLFVIFVLLPAMVLFGLAMSPRMDAWWPGWVDLVGGRQGARTLHFAGALLIVGFFLIHVFEVIVTGVWNNLRSMITGRYRIEEEKPHEP
jgi:thiosulfate reductase cytochrome b subunit